MCSSPPRSLALPSRDTSASRERERLRLRDDHVVNTTISGHIKTLYALIDFLSSTVAKPPNPTHNERADCPSNHHVYLASPALMYESLHRQLFAWGFCVFHKTSRGFFLVSTHEGISNENV